MEDDSKYKWETNASSWDAVQEDEHGNIVSFVAERDRSHRAKARRITSSIRRGLIRYTVFAIDCSSAALEKDFRPTRLESIKLVGRKFVLDYFDQNPISQLSVIVTKDRVAKKVTELSGNPKYHEDKISNLDGAEGEASLQNIVNLSLNILRNIPEYGTRELVIVYNSLKTRDPGNIFDTIAEAKRLKIRVSVICTAAEMYICKKLTEDTGGIFGVAVDPLHLSELLMRHVAPPPDLKNRSQLATDFIYMGFPRKTVQSNVVLAVDGNKPKPVTSSYVCPRCFTRCTELPIQCGVCRLQLTSSSHIARSHHHLFPVPNFIEVRLVRPPGGDSEATVSTRPPADELEFEAPPSILKVEDTAKKGTESDVAAVIGATMRVRVRRPSCTGCLTPFAAESLGLLCPACRCLFCVDCDLFVHDSLHNCPGC